MLSLVPLLQLLNPPFLLLIMLLISRLLHRSFLYSEAQTGPTVRISDGVFLSRLKTHLFSKSFHPQPSLSPTEDLTEC